MDPLLTKYLMFLLIVSVPMILISFFILWEKRNYNRLMIKGKTVVAWVVKANEVVFEPDFDCAPAQILICFEEDTPALRECLAKIKAKMFELHEREPANDDERLLFDLVLDQRTRPGIRIMVPPSMSEGREVYVTSILIKELFLRKRRLVREYVMCRAIPGEDGGEPMMIRYFDDPKAKIKA